MKHQSFLKIKGQIRENKRAYTVISLVVLTLLAGGLVADAKAHGSIISRIRIRTSSPTFTWASPTPSTEPTDEATMEPSPTSSASISSASEGDSSVKVHINNTNGNTSAHVETNTSDNESTSSNNKPNVKIESTGDAKVTQDPNTGQINVNMTNGSANIQSKSSVKSKQTIKSRSNNDVNISIKQSN
jgi:hypothetical protein